MIPIEFFILAAAVIGAAIGCFGTCIIASGKIRRIERETWSTAERHYAARMQDLIRR